MAEDEDEGDEAGGEAGDDDEAPGRSSGEAPIDLGDPAMVQLGLLRRDDMKVVRIKRDPGSVAIDGHAVPAKEAVVHLVTRYGLREADAREALGDAEVAGRLGHAITVKRADDPERRGSPYLTGAGGPTAPPMEEPEYGTDDQMGSKATAIRLQESARLANGVPDPQSARDVYSDADGQDPAMLRLAERASDADGQHDVFDAAVVGSLLKGTRDDLLIDQHVGPMAKALDHIGRMLFSFYWHRDQFAERFGESDLPEVEDSLRNNFESLGDMVLFLRQKSVEASPAQAAADVDLDHSSDS